MDRQLLGSIGLMMLAMSLIPLGDSAGKLLVQDHGAGSGFVAFSRFAVGAALIAVILGGRVEWGIWRDWRVWFRAGLIAAGIACILTALQTASLASVFGAFFVGPIISYVLSVTLLRERPSRVRLVLLGLGFVGVLCVVQPGFGMEPGLPWAVLAGVFYGSYLTASRWIGGIAGPRQLMLTQTVLGSVMLMPLGVVSTPPDWSVSATVLVLVSGLASATGNLLLVGAYRRTDASVLAPLVYFQLVAATVLGLVVFGDWPDALSLAGLVILLLSGMATLFIRR